MERRKIGFIGSGTMASAIIGRLISFGVKPEDLRASDVVAERRDALKVLHGIETLADSGAVAEWSEVLVLATKPQSFAKMIPQIAKHVDPQTLILSIAAGVPVVAIEDGLPGDTRVIRAMPNTPALVGAGATAICAGTHATDEDLKFAHALFSQIGICEVLDESAMDAVTGLSGSGPAFVFVMIEALADAGVKVGLHRSVAQRLAAQTVRGAATLLQETGEHPGRLKDMVASPGGTTIAGLHVLESGGIRTTLMNAVDAATARSRELGEESAQKLRDKPLS